MTNRLNQKTEEAAAFIRVSPRTLEKWRLTGEGPVFQKLGRSVRYSTKDLIRFLERKWVTLVASKG